MNRNLSLALVALLFIFAKCKKENEVPANLCLGKTPFKADFTIEESVGDTSYITDKALAPGYVYFKAKGQYDSVRWYIGGPQNTSTRPNHALYFAQAEGPVEVTMIGYKKPNTACFATDKAVDTVRKTIRILPRDSTAAIVGRFLGYNTDNPSDTFSVNIKAETRSGLWDFFVKNIPKNCPGYIQVSDGYPRYIGLVVSGAHSAFQISAGSSMACVLVTGFGYLKTKDSLVINYSAVPMDPGPPYVPYLPLEGRRQFTFIGVRQP